MSYQPFVVGTESAGEMNEQVLTSPTVQTIEQGARVRVKATPADGQIQLMTDIAISQIMEVDTFTSPSPDSRTTVQVPSQRIRQVHLASLVKPGTTVLIDPNFTEPVSTNRRKGRQKPVERKLLVTLRAQIVDMDEDPDATTVATTSAPQSR